MEENISAISTASGVGGVAIIRISGKSPLEIAKKIFTPIGKTSVDDFEPYKMYVGEIDGGGFKDYGMCVYFKGPKSYTGEDMVELHCHGGIAISRGILRRTFEFGARPATNGEFTKRAFMNGKMSLSSCEGLIDMINSQSVGEVKAGYFLYREKLCQKIKKMQDEITYVLAYIDAGIDYPEEGVVEDNEEKIVESISSILVRIKKLREGYLNGRKIKSGVKVAIVGKPNTGKSSLLNCLLNYDKAIVSSYAGTTRDVVEGEIDIDGIRYLLYDTAGIHESDDFVEKIGIDRSHRALDECDICVVVVDGSNEIDDSDKRVLTATENKKRIIVLNKIDLGNVANIDKSICISVKNNDNIDTLRSSLSTLAMDGKLDHEADFLTEERHFLALGKACDSLQLALDNMGVSTLDIIAVDLKNAWDSLGEISGETAGEMIIDEIFSKFCVGK